MSEVVVRPAVSGEEKILAAIHIASWQAAFAPILSTEDLRRFTDPVRVEDIYRRQLDKGSSGVFLLEVDGAPQGFAVWGQNRDETEPYKAELICIHSLVGSWGKGNGSRLLSCVLRDMVSKGYREAVLWVFRENKRARRFYEKNGFLPTDRVKIAHGGEEIQYRRELV